MKVKQSQEAERECSCGSIRECKVPMGFFSLGLNLGTLRHSMSEYSVSETVQDYSKGLDKMTTI